jgi:CRISPR-associated exonuclease Cas4
MTPEACEAEGGIRHWPGVACPANALDLCPKLLRACCNSTACNLKCEAECIAGGGTFLGNSGWGKVEKPLFHAALGLTGKPDYLIEKNGQIIPVEVKSGRAPEAPYDSHIFQLASYCLLVEKTYRKRPPYGIIHYENRDFAIEYTRELETALIELLADMRVDEVKKDVPRSHDQPSRCKRCGFRNVCDQKLA